jgi:hypothetical protein
VSPVPAELSRLLRQAWRTFVERLPLPRERVRLEIYPHRVVATRFSAKGAALARRTAHAALPAGAAPWAAALAELAPLLAQPEFSRAPAEIVLSNHFVRYVVVPWRDDLSGVEERLAYVRHCFVQAYGAAAAQWLISHSDARFGEPAVAAAIEPALLEAVRAAAASAALRVDSVEPFLAAVFNNARSGIGAHHYWFVAAERGRACIARVDAGGWQSLRCQRLGDDWQRELPLLLTRERLLGGAADTATRVYLYAPELTGAGLHEGEWTARGLKMPSASGIAEPPELAAVAAMATNAEVRA